MKIVKKTKRNIQLPLILQVLSHPQGPGYTIMQFVPEEYMLGLWCSRFKSLAACAKSTVESCRRQRLSQVLARPGRGEDMFAFLASHVNIVVTGLQVVYALNFFMPAGHLDYDDRKLPPGRFPPSCDMDRRPKVFVLSTGYNIRNPIEIKEKLNLVFRRKPLIYRTMYETPEQLIREFDYDCLRCYFHRNKFGGTASAQTAHRLRESRIPKQLFLAAHQYGEQLYRRSPEAPDNPDGVLYWFWAIRKELELLGRLGFTLIYEDVAPQCFCFCSICKLRKPSRKTFPATSFHLKYKERCRPFPLHHPAQRRRVQF